MGMWMVSKPTTKSLSDRQEAFLAAYLGDAGRNATKAAELAGYRHPMQQGHRLLRNAEIQQAIQAWRDDLKNFAITSMTRRLEGIDGLRLKLFALIDSRAERYRDEA